MNPGRSFVLRTFLLAVLGALLVASEASAAEYATFDAFYKEGGLLGWGSLLVATLTALAAGAFVVFTGGTGGPVVAAIGSWVGGMMGFSGAVATNAGLALLGGGALAAGGFGMTGGAALITGVMTFSTDLAITASAEYLENLMNQKYDYRKLQEESAYLVTLPTPVNTRGSNVYRRAMEILDKIDEERPIQDPQNRIVLGRAIRTLVSGLNETEDLAYRVKDQAMLSLLYFLRDDYRKAKESASHAINMAQRESIAYTLPQFIHATSLLATDPDLFDESVIGLRQAVLGESDNSFFPGDQPNKIIPVMFAAYLDRMMLLYVQGELPDDAFGSVADIMDLEALSDFRAHHLSLLLFRELGLLKIYQQRILGILETDNARIRNSPETARYLGKAFRRYDALSREARSTAMKLSESDLNDEVRGDIHQMISTAYKYHYSRIHLSSVICDFSTRQGGSLELYDLLRCE